MKVSIATIVTAALLVASAAFADEQAVRHIRVAVDDGQGPVAIEMSGDDALDPAELQVGESRSLVDDEGRDVLVTRTADGVEFSVDGRTIRLPLAETAGAVPLEGEVGLRVLELQGPDAEDDNAITIISRDPLDETVRETIRAALAAAGESRPVVFIDRSAGAGTGRQIHIVTRQVNTTN